MWILRGPKIQQSILALEKNILELNASFSQIHCRKQSPNLLKGIEEIYPDMICSVLEVDDAQEKVHHLSAPRLPVAYCNFIDGSAIGPKAGSCGTAVYHRSQVIVSNIETDPLWEDYTKTLFFLTGLKPCWSTRIISSQQFAGIGHICHLLHHRSEPKDDELQMIERTTNILCILIENKKNQDHVKDQTQRLHEIATISSHELRRPVATILGLVNLFDRENVDSVLNNEILNHLESTVT